MKKLITILAVLFMSYNLSAIQFDSCIIAPIGHIFMNFKDAPHNNLDSLLLLDTCGFYNIYKKTLPSPENFYKIDPSLLNGYGRSYRKLYSKGLWEISFKGKMVFDTTIMNLANSYYFNIANLDKKNQDLIDFFTNLQNQHGKIFFYPFLSKDRSLKEFYEKIGLVYSKFYMYLDDYVNTYDFEQKINDSGFEIYCKFFSNYMFPISVENNNDIKKEIGKNVQVNLNENSIQLISDTAVNSISIYSMNGIEVMSIDNIVNNQIDISNLPSGMYFVQFDNKFEKFIIMR